MRKTEAPTSLQPLTWEYFWNAQGRLRKLRRPDGTEWDTDMTPSAVASLNVDPAVIAVSCGMAMS